MIVNRHPESEKELGFLTKCLLSHNLTLCSTGGYLNKITQCLATLKLIEDF